ncbi:hypothetical protein CC2G_006904 [Coprinopsis cinerea AmutBmut pab1-1]|nr:hypothetical protein CC2G_006904 [Coprinopsis cinerea AmutBmut pab1-1]
MNLQVGRDPEHGALSEILSESALSDWSGAPKHFFHSSPSSSWFSALDVLYTWSQLTLTKTNCPLYHIPLTQTPSG